MKRYRLSQTVHIISIIFVLSYISFHVLDLDLSDFPTSESSAETTLMIIEAPETTELANAMSENSVRIISSLLRPTRNESFRFQNANLLRHMRFRDARVRLRRLTIPHSSPPDSSPAA